MFAYEPRNQGKSESIPGYEPLQWIANYEVEDARAALAYLKGRPDKDPRQCTFDQLKQKTADPMKLLA